jgi:hypothetical protein
VLAFLDAIGSRKEAKALRNIDSLTERLVPLEYEHYLARPGHPHPKLIDLLSEQGLLNLADRKGLTSVESKRFLARAAVKLARVSLSPILLVLTHTLQASHLLVHYIKDRAVLNEMNASHSEGNLLAYIGPPFSLAKYSRDGDFILIDMPSQPILNGYLANKIVILAQDDSGTRACVLVVGKDELDLVEKLPARIGLLTTDVAVLALRSRRMHVRRALAIDVPLGPLAAEQTHIALVWLVGALAGITKEALLSAVERSRQRFQWGKPIYQHELVRKHLASIFCDLQALDAMAFYLCTPAAAAKESPSQPNQNFDREAKVSLLNVALELTMDAVDRAVQIFGGFGYSLLSPIARHYLDVQALSALLRSSVDFDEVSARAALAST